MKYVMCPHGGSGNHGCEAIVRSTVKLVGNETTLFTNKMEEDCKVGLQDLCKLDVAEKSISSGSLSHLFAIFRNKVLTRTDAFDRLVFQHIVESAKNADYVLGIGGDNYCYNTPEFIYLVNRMVDEAKIKRILWGASVEPNAIDERMIRDLRGYHKIWARESLTYEALLAKGLTQTFLLPDPAFVLDRKDLPLPNGFVEGNTVGINVSPMIIGYEKNQGMALQNYVNLLKYIIEGTDMQVALIPHVVWSHNDDRKPLTQLYDMFKDTGRVVIIKDHNAMELKGYIARCRFMVVARTHASIAAYSTQVPTLVVGYSVKARGIAKDIFGTEDNYVIPVQSLTHGDELMKGFMWMMDHEADIKAHYAEMMPNYIEKVYQIRTILGISKNVS
ncbi:MAG: polysaccharide pyruvyl transferase family protein [Bacteroidaceae bacterium]|nr:polysaccharide pyruvyl transferase family protein [Bacteroidaceae bacterium]